MRKTVLAAGLPVLALVLLAAVLGLSPAGQPAGASAPVHISDPARALTPEQVLQRAAAMQADGRGGALAIDAGTYWWVGDVHNPGDGERWVVHLGNTAIEKATLFVFEQDRLLSEAAVDLRALASDGLPDYTIGHHLPFHLPPDRSRTLVLRIETPVAHDGLIFIKPHDAAKREAYFHMVAVWGAAGAMAALILYNLLLGIGLRLPVYLFYVGHAAGHLLYLLTAMGMVGAGLPVLERYLALNIPGIVIGVFCGALFIYRFLELPTLCPRLALLYRGFMGALLALPLFALILEPHALLTAARASHLLLAPLVLAAAVIGLVKNRREARYILVGWGVMIALTVQGMLGVLGVVELTVEAGVWAFWAVLFEMFFLSLALADRVRRLSYEKQMAERANEAKSAFLANMGHEIRTPLNGVLGMVDALAQTGVDSRQRKYLAYLRQSGKALLSLLDDVLDYSRLEAGRVELKPVAFSPRQLMDELQTLLAREAYQKGLTLSFSVTPAVPARVVGDLGRIRQVLLNLVGNAVKFTEQGEVRVQLDSTADRAAARLRFTVNDTGIGIPAESLSTIFGRFHQADGSINRRYGGSGLGLAIARELVDLMGGEIAVESRPGEGSCFTLELPLPVAEQPQQTAESVEAPPALDILVVEDEPINRLVVQELLKGEGHRVETVDGGPAALERWGERPFDLVLMDVSMPDMDGLEVTRRLRAAGCSGAVIGLTAHVLPEQTQACLAAGMDAVVHKPLEIGKLNGAIARVLGTATPAAAPAAG